MDATDPTIKLLLEIRDEIRAMRRDFLEPRIHGPVVPAGDPVGESALMAATALLVAELKVLVREITVH